MSLNEYKPDKRYTSSPVSKHTQLKGVDFGVTTTTGTLLLEFDKFMIGKTAKINNMQSANKEVIIQEYEVLETGFFGRKKRYLAVFPSLDPTYYWVINVIVLLPSGKEHLYFSTVKIVAGEVGVFNFTEITQKELVRLDNEENKKGNGLSSLQQAFLGLGDNSKKQKTINIVEELYRKENSQYYKKSQDLKNTPLKSSTSTTNQPPAPSAAKPEQRKESVTQQNQFPTEQVRQLRSYLCELVKEGTAGKITQEQLEERFYTTLQNGFSMQWVGDQQIVRYLTMPSGLTVDQEILYNTTFLPAFRRMKTQPKKQEKTTEPPTFIFCMNCGKKLPHTAKFCQSCGTKIEALEE